MQELQELGVKIGELYQLIFDRIASSPCKQECFDCYLAIQIYYDCPTIEDACEKYPDYKRLLSAYFADFREYSSSELAELAIKTLNAATEGELND